MAAALLLLAPVLTGCAEMGDRVSSAFADPAKYDLYDCKQLEAERKLLSKREAETQGLMAKADDGFAGPVVAELAYRNDYVAIRGQSHLAEDAWRRNNCHESPPEVPKPDLAAIKAKTAAARSTKPAATPKKTGSSAGN